jgi:hypothetical protein
MDRAARRCPLGEPGAAGVWSAPPETRCGPDGSTVRPAVFSALLCSL